MKKLILLVVLTSLCSQAEERKLWKLSIAAVAVSTAADVHSSFGMRELNPLLRGPGSRFGVQSALLKTGVVCVLLLGQKLFLPGRSGRMKGWSALNFSMAATTGAFAVHNYAIRR